ncbi:MAG: beta-1,6-N-acetylglucosaminyltransferase [Mucilaginibacter sp.]
MRLAHLILVHSNPQQAERLIKRLTNAQADVYIHLDGKCNIDEYAHLTQIDNAFFIANRTVITWANYSMIDATLKSFEEILDKSIDYSHINLLSGQDYPLKKANDIQQFLFDNRDKTFMRFRDVYNDWPETISRFELYSFGDYNFPFKFRIQKLFNKLLPAKKLPKGLIAYGFSQWFTITPVCAKYVIKYIKDHPDVRRFFRMTWGVDELVFQTVLLNSPLKGSIVNDHLRYIKFEERGTSPKILTMEDADVLVNSGKFYARKFNPAVDNDILDFLDRVAER